MTIKNDRQLGTPFTEYRDTKATIIATPNPIGGMVAYATDTGEEGYYNGLSGTWIFRSGTSGAKQMLMGTGLSSTVPINSIRYLIVNQALVLQASAFNLEITAPCTISNLSVTTNGAQPANNSLVMTVNKNNVNTALTVTIPAGSVAGTFTSGASVSFAAGDSINIEADNNDTTAVSAPITRHSLLVTFT